jgi:hypothetical protein
MKIISSDTLFRSIVWLAICFLLSFLFAITWVVVSTYTLPKTDLAYGQSPFEDELVFPIMSMIASAAAIIVFPFTYYALRDRTPLNASTVVAVIVLAEIVLVTPLNSAAGFVGSFLAFGIGLLAARQVSRPRAYPQKSPAIVTGNGDEK